MHRRSEPLFARNTPRRPAPLRPRAARLALLPLALLVAGSIPCLNGCGQRRGDRRPSIVLIVIDTLRADAVSSYGSVEGTTPTLDALAREGQLYEHARAPAPWTLPSHASLLTGLGVETHRVGMPARVALPDEIPTLAERLRDAGYQTAAFSENMLVSDSFSLLQGFEARAASHVEKLDRTEGMTMDLIVDVDAAREAQRWIGARDRTRPFFLFVNIFDTHSPSEVREENPWVPPGSTRRDMLSRSEHPNWLLCGALPSPHELAVLHGLYLGDVHAADAKIARILESLSAQDADDSIFTIVTSDHVELFGEGRLLGHEFSLREPALRVPLIVRPPGGRQPVRIAEPVSLLDLAPSILDWVGLPVPPEWPGRPLPSGARESDERARSLLSAYRDAYPSTLGMGQGGLGRRSKALPRAKCDGADRVFGNMVSLLRYPFKLQWFERYPPQLYDLSWDPEEKSDVAAHHPELVARLAEQAAGFAAVATRDSPAESGAGAEPSEDAIRALRELGYIR